MIDNDLVYRPPVEPRNCEECGTQLNFQWLLGVHCPNPSCKNYGGEAPSLAQKIRDIESRVEALEAKGILRK